jgi:hypothetical protein
MPHEPRGIPNEVAVVVRLIGRHPQLLSREIGRERPVHQQRVWAELFRGEEDVEPPPLDRHVNIVGGDEGCNRDLGQRNAIPRRTRETGPVVTDLNVSIVRHEESRGLTVVRFSRNAIEV